MFANGVIVLFVVRVLVRPKENHPPIHNIIPVKDDRSARPASKQEDLLARWKQAFFVVFILET